VSGSGSLKHKAFWCLYIDRSGQIRAPSPPTPPLPQKNKNSPDLHQLQERPLAKAYWTRPPGSTVWRRPCGRNLRTKLYTAINSLSANAATRLIFPLKRSDHITDALVSLHWLRVPEPIQYKVAVLGYRVLHGRAPRYLGPLTRVADVPGRRTLRSAATNRLFVPSVKLSIVGSRAFPAGASSI